MQSAIVCSSVHTRIPAKTQSKDAALLGEESAASLRRAEMQSNAIFGGALGDAYFTVYRRRNRRKIGPHGKRTGPRSIFPYFSRGELGSHWRDRVRQDADCPVRDGGAARKCKTGFR